MSPVQVMIVEDEIVIALDLEDQFRHAGFAQPVTFSTCAAGLGWLEKNRPDVAVLDAILSDGPCLGIARRLREIGVPFLIFSGRSEHQRDASELDGVAWIEKPAREKEVVEMAASLLPP